MAAKRKAQREPAARDRDSIRRLRFLGLLIDGRHLQEAGVEAHRPDDPLPVCHLEHRLKRGPVTRRRRNVDDPAHVANPVATEEGHRAPGGSCKNSQHAVAFSYAGRGHVLHALLPLDPALLRHDHHRVFVDDESLCVELGFVELGCDAGAPRVRVVRGQLEELCADQLPARGRALEQLLHAHGFLLFLPEFAPNLEHL